MAISLPGLFGRFFSGLWWLLDGSRRLVFNLLFLLLLVTVVAAAVFALRGPAPLQDKTVLVLDLGGALVEQRSGTLRDSLLSQAQGQAPQQLQLRDVLDVLDAAAKDPKISQALLLLDDFKGAGPASLREVAAALQRFKASGKALVAWGSSYDQRQYYLGAQAGEVLLHPMGTVTVEGYGGYRNYYRDALDKLGVSVNLIRVGTYKSFGEPFIANGPSTASTEADQYLYGGLWASYTDGVEKARKLPAGSIMKLIDELPQRIVAAGGDFARLALDARMVDGLKTRDQMRQMMIERGALDDDEKTFRQVNFDDYLARVKQPDGGDSVGVIVAEGDISDGEAPPGRIGGRSTAALVRQAREDKDIKALVLRVDSPGGSAFGAELVRRELELTRAAGKPVVVSMGDLAASGGYWIATSADEIIADAATVTGSIGVFTILPTAEKTLELLGVHTAGVTTTWLGGAGDPRRALDPRFAAVLQSSVDHTYAEFIQRAALARKRTPQQIDAVAQGRVWTGSQALERGLVDRLGSYGDALGAAASRAKLAGAEQGEFSVRYIEREPSRLQRVLSMAGADALVGAAASLGGIELGLRDTGLPWAAVRDMQDELLWLADMAQHRKPSASVVHCLCAAP
jgi:protease-4